MKKTVYPSDEVTPLHDKFIWAYLDTDESDNAKVAKEFKVEGIPHIEFLDKEGKSLGSQVGILEPDAFAKILEGMLKKAGAAAARLRPRRAPDPSQSRATMTRHPFLATVAIVIGGLSCPMTSPCAESRDAFDAVYSVQGHRRQGHLAQGICRQGAAVVNVASRCGYTKQYAGLQALHEKLSPKGFSVLGFPSNDFGGQEPGTEAEIKSFCSTKYNVTFPLFQKVKVKGPDQHPLVRRADRPGIAVARRGEVELRQVSHRQRREPDQALGFRHRPPMILSWSPPSTPPSPPNNRRIGF